MNILTSQRGVGLIEVLVAVLLLSVAVLGFSALQMRAISATDESLVRTKSLTIVRNLAEVMRAYPEAYVIASGTTFKSATSTETEEEAPAEVGGLPTTLAAQPTIQAVTNSAATNTVVISHVKTNTDGSKTTVSKTVSILATGENCLSTTTDTVNTKVVPKQSCNINELAARDALMIKKMAADESITVSVATCPGSAANAIQKQMCVITAWNGTKAILDDADTEACAKADGTYKVGSQCLISEAY
ncbi:type IV pilus modification protein PilV [uncultured Psychrobacter sp.]|uniref:type IV pilus modification protein PilV n=1 Tax=uncultured Psychrobacter sp. TaxID=259303 RepID=UPI0030DB9A4D|tara:strand:+ start:1832 stop:2566 length:735 start_codon:yes stop_codon:yes gene_type:complete